MPGLIRGVARTAVIAGTATAVSNRVSRRQAGRWAQGQQRGYPQPEPAAAEPAAAEPAAAEPAAAEPAAAEPATDDASQRRIDQLRQLADLRAQGVLTEAEFEAEKARILRS